MNKKILDAIESCGIDNDVIIETWKEIVEIESYTHNAEGVCNVCKYIKNQLEELGLETKVYDFENSGPLLIGKCGEGDNSEGVILAGHMDTVFKDGFIFNNPFRVEDSKVFGPGVLDMKGGINLIFYIIKILKELKYNKPIKVIISGDEEHGHGKSNCAELMEEEAKGYKCAFNMETGLVDNSVTIARKGRMGCTIKTKGLSAHAGANFSDGISAIYEIANKILEIKKLNEKYENATFSVGIVNGGTIANAVPDYAEIQLDIRFVDDDNIESIKQDLNNIVESSIIEGTKSELIIDSYFPSFVSKYNKEFYELVKSISIKDGFGEPKGVLLGGASDAAYITRAGVPCLCSMGVKGEWNHTNREYALVDSAIERVILIVDSILELENKTL
ncbi:M20/M25/M40 family metallo-hydrolase [Wukongibacter sp. M2B1]|uniref:M20/M25/M40 family metallo-hydrolase n=1 Tax=Wukongibacter sp. M2B1 TaxID=3088895 RepID=UPI003D7960F3